MHIWINKEQCQFEIGHQRQSIPGKRCSQKSFDYLFNYLHDPISSEHVPLPVAEGPQEATSCFSTQQEELHCGSVPIARALGNMKNALAVRKKEIWVEGEMRKWKDVRNYPLILFVNMVLPFSLCTACRERWTLGKTVELDWKGVYSTNRNHFILC